MSASAIYRGTVRHRRFAPKLREFRHTVTYFYIDLGEVSSHFSVPGLFSDRAPSLFGFRRKAYLGPVELPLDEAVRRRVETVSGRRPVGPIRMLTQIAYFGYAFNPVTFYYCFDAEGVRVTDVIAEITNTPWGERHTYVLAADANGSTAHFDFPKQFHVSPFLGMDYRYRWGFSPPEALLNIHMENHAPGAESATFDATLTLKRRPWTNLNVGLAILRQPALTFQTLFLIYLHALILFVRRIPFVAHPKGTLP